MIHWDGSLSTGIDAVMLTFPIPAHGFPQTRAWRRRIQQSRNKGFTVAGTQNQGFMLP
jgi:hypothetical protein